MSPWVSGLKKLGVSSRFSIQKCEISCIGLCMCPSDLGHACSISWVLAWNGSINMRSFHLGSNFIQISNAFLELSKAQMWSCYTCALHGLLPYSEKVQHTCVRVVLGSLTKPDCQMVTCLRRRRYSPRERVEPHPMGELTETPSPMCLLSENHHVWWFMCAWLSVFTALCSVWFKLGETHKIDKGH